MVSIIKPLLLRSNLMVSRQFLICESQLSESDALAFDKSTGEFLRLLNAPSDSG